MKFKNTSNSQELIEQLITYALTTKQTKFRQLRSWKEFRYCKSLSRSLSLVISSLRAGQKQLFKSYCADIVKATAKTSKIMAYYQLSNVITFYENELSIINLMVEEYYNYLYDGHFLEAFLLGSIRNI